MPNLKIIRLGNPILRRASKAVTQAELKTLRFQKFLDNLSQTCIKNNGAGIAAPQVGINKRVIVVHIDPKNPRYPKQSKFPLTILINPKIIKTSRALVNGWEGDLSFDIRGLVPRPYSCEISGLDRYGKKVKFKLSGFPARVFQHEIDHLYGKLLIDRVKNMGTLTEMPEWKKFWKNYKPS